MERPLTKEDNQREAMYNGWAKYKVFLTPQKKINEDKAEISVIYNGEEYKEVFTKQDDIFNFGLDYYNMAYNKLLSRMQTINKNIEIKY